MRSNNRTEQLISQFVGLVLAEARKVREADISDGSRVPHGSTKHIKDLEARIKQLVHFRDKLRRGTDKRADYNRLIGRLKSELASAKRVRPVDNPVHRMNENINNRSLNKTISKALKNLSRIEGKGFYGQDIPVNFGRPALRTAPQNVRDMIGDYETVPHKIKVLNLNELTPTQRVVERGHLASVIKANIKSLPLVVKWQGQLLILDGHHRLMAEFLKGLTQVKVRFVDLDWELR